MKKLSPTVLTIIIIIVVLLIAFIIYALFAKTTTTTKTPIPNTNPNVPNTNPNNNTAGWLDILGQLGNAIKDWWSSSDDSSLPAGFTTDCCGNQYDETGQCFGVCFPCDPTTDC